MPQVACTGQSDHGFVTVEQLRLNLMMQAAMLVELAVDRTATQQTSRAK